MTETDPNRGTDGSLLVVTSITVGMLAGALIALFVIRPPEPPTAEPEVDAETRDYTAQELEVVCLPYMRQTATALEGAQTRVSALEIRIRSKEQEIARLEQQFFDERGQKREVGERLAEARAQLDRLEEQLAGAKEDKAGLLDDLARTKEQLAGTRIELAASEARVVEAREENLDQKWTNFVQTAMLQICTGSIGKVETCRFAVDAALSRHRRRYKGCVRSGGAVPEVKQSKRGEVIPEAYAVYLNQSDRELRDWYVLFCDPDLPEADGPSEEPPPVVPEGYKTVEDFD